MFGCTRVPPLTYLFGFQLQKSRMGCLAITWSKHVSGSEYFLSNAQTLDNYKAGWLKVIDCGLKHRYICERPLKGNTAKGQYRATAEGQHG